MWDAARWSAARQNKIHRITVHMFSIWFVFKMLFSRPQLQSRLFYAFNYNV